MCSDQVPQSTRPLRNSTATRLLKVYERSVPWSFRMASFVNYVSQYSATCKQHSLTTAPVSDASVLLRDIAGDAAQKTAGKVRPSEDQLNSIDQPAEDNTWHDVPNLSPANLKAQAKDQYNKNKPMSRNDLKNATGDATQAAHPSGSRDPADAAMLEADSQNQGTDSGMDPQAGAYQAKDKLMGTAKDNVPQETQDKMRNTRDRTQNYMSSKVPKERRDQTVLRLKKMIVEIQGHSDC